VEVGVRSLYCIVLELVRVREKTRKPERNRHEHDSSLELSLDPRSALPLACTFGISRLHFTCIPPVSISPYPYPIPCIVYCITPCIPVLSILYLSISHSRSRSTVSHCIPLYPSCIRIRMYVCM